MIGDLSYISVLNTSTVCHGLPVNWIIDMAIRGLLTWNSRWPVPN